MKPTIRKFGHRWVLTVQMADGTVLDLNRPSWESCVRLLGSGRQGLNLFAGFYSKRKPMRTEVSR